MKLLFLYSIIFILFAFTKENITYIDKTNYNSQCNKIDTFIDSNYAQRSISDYAFNAEFCRLKETQTSTNPPGGRLRNLKGSKVYGNICCYISILDNLGNWDYFCGEISESEYNDNKISERIDSLKGSPNFSKDFKNIKIDCFSKKIDFMIKALIIGLICLI